MQETGDSDRLRELPATLHGLVAARLDALDPAERSLLEDCAIVGASGPIAAVLALADRADAPTLLDGLAERDLLELDDDEFHFKSELIREIAYGTLTKAERARRHARVAPVLDARGEPAIDEVAHHLATAAELVGELGAVAGVPADVREQAIDALVAPPTATSASSRGRCRPPPRPRARPARRRSPSPERWRALLGRGRAAVQRRHLDAARDDLLAVLAEATEAGELRPQAEALTLLGDGGDDAARTTSPRRRSARRSSAGASSTTRRAAPTCCAGSACRTSSAATSSRPSGSSPRRSARSARRAASGARRGRCRTWRGSRSRTATSRTPRTGSRSRPTSFGELGDWGGLSWAYGLLAFVRYNQGRLEEAAALAEHIAIEGRETGNRWAVGMMDVLLANVALWSGRMSESVERGSDAIALFQEIGDRWGEVMATGSVVRALAELGHDDEYADTLAHYREISRDMPDEGMRTFPEVVEALVDLQQGRPDAAQAILETLDIDGERRQRPARSRRRLRRDRASRCCSSATSTARSTSSSAATRPRPTTARRWRSAAGSRSRTRPRTAPTTPTLVVAELQRPQRRHVLRPHDRALGREPRAHATGSGDGRGSVDAAYAIATATDARSSTRSPRWRARGCSRRSATDDADDAADDADGQLDAARPHRRRLARVFDLALAERQGSLVSHRRGAELIEHDVAGAAVGERRHAGRHLAGGHGVAHDLGEAAHRRRGDGRRRRASGAASGVRSSRVPSARRTEHPLVGQDLAHRVGAEHREPRRDRRARREACCRCAP